MKIFIAGPILGHPEYKAMFRKVEEKLILRGNLVFNPAVLPIGFKESDDYLPITKRMIDACRAVYLLPGWEDSKGAIIEAEYATNKDKLVYEYNMDTMETARLIDKRDFHNLPQPPPAQLEQTVQYIPELAQQKVKVLNHTQSEDEDNRITATEYDINKWLIDNTAVRIQQITTAVYTTDQGKISTQIIIVYTEIKPLMIGGQTDEDK